MSEKHEEDPIKDVLISQELQKAATAAVAEPDGPAVEKADKTGKAAKELIYQAVGQKLEDAFKQPYTVGGIGRLAFDSIIDAILSGVKYAGYIRFNDGNGALEFKKRENVVRKLPGGGARILPVSYRIHYVMGAATKRMLAGQTEDLAGVTADQGGSVGYEPVADSASGSVDEQDTNTAPETLDLE